MSYQFRVADKLLDILTGQRLAAQWGLNHMDSPTLSRGTTSQYPAIRIGISSCLLGENVRYNGGHTRDTMLVQWLGPFVEWVLVCPEVEVGMGTPRETVRLEEGPNGPRMIGSESRRDWTDTVESWAREKVEGLTEKSLHGYIFKRSSPSCGLYKVKVFNRNGIPERKGRGLYAGALTSKLPLLPVEEEGRLIDPALRENFVERIFAYYRWTQLLENDPSPADLISFHTGYKLTLLSHSPSHYRRLGSLVGSLTKKSFTSVLDEYGQGLMRTLQIMASRERHANVMHHLMGHLKDHLDDTQKQEVLGLIEDYR
ncbi:MAG TPA: DUF523 and DUF1722 domain-containing protein, partial [Acidobacteriota bacterium]|nr:DUF523 and DUF1722 domain-containing protein [Acidobacteriota bacterium]